MYSISIRTETEGVTPHVSRLLPSSAGVKLKRAPVVAAVSRPTTAVTTNAHIRQIGRNWCEFGGDQNK